MPPLSPLSKILIAAGTTVAFGLTALIGMMLARQTNGITLISPANAMLLAALLLTPDPRFRLATLACCALTDLMLGLAFDRSLAHSLAFTLADTFEVVVAFQLITRSCRSPIELAKVSDLTHFCIAAGLLAPLLPALAATAMTSSNHGAALATIFGTRFISDALAFLVVTPAIVLLSTQERVTPRSRPMAEVIGLFSLLSITTAVVFSQTQVAITLLPILILILMACRLGPGLAAAATLLMTAIILLCTAKGLGPASQLARIRPRRPNSIRRAFDLRRIPRRLASCDTRGRAKTPRNRARHRVRAA
jgi:integral membrane sensor domain MASE1